VSSQPSPLLLYKLIQLSFFHFAVSQSKGKHSDRGSTGSIHQVHSLLPCTSGSKHVIEALVSGGCQTEDEAEETGNGYSQEVVDSPVKEPHAYAQLPQSGVTEPPSVLVSLDSNALEVVEATVGKSMRLHVHSFNFGLHF
jgi:hypothetical protein